MKCRLLQLLLLLSGILVAVSSRNLDPELESEFNANYIEQVLRNMNPSIDPCEDFYAFACGNWSANYKDTQNYLDMPGYLDYKYNAQLLTVLEKQHLQGGIYEQLLAYYVSCRDLKQPALNELLHRLELELQLEWPIFRGNQSEMWRNETQFDWLSMLAKLRAYGLNGIFIKQDVNVRRENGTHYVILLAPQPSEAPPLTEQEIHHLYVAFGLDMQLAKKLTAKLMQLEWRLKNVKRDAAVSEMYELNLLQLQQQLPQIDWRHYLKMVLGAPPPATQLLQVSSLSSRYLEQLQTILAESSNETICYYIMFKLLYGLSEELPVGGNRKMSCVLQLRGHMPLAMNYLYEQHYYKVHRQRTDAALQRLQRGLSGEFERLVLENNLQLNGEEQSLVLEELHTLRLKICNMPRDLQMKELTAYYRDVQLQPNDFYGNKLQLLRFYQRREQQQLKNQAGSFAAHDYYQQEPLLARSSSPVKIFQNAVVLPHAYLQLPLYDARLSVMLQHAQLGFILAHELQHAFDLFHIVYDARGNYNQTGVHLLEHFGNFTSCYTRGNSEQLLLSESMSDIVGLRLAYDSYFNHRQRVEQQQSVEDYTEEQLFFINSVQFLCANMERIMIVNTTRDVEHGLHNERVNRNWPHHDQFAKTFNCTPGQAMFQPKPCRLW
ncbi:neprilysin-4 [Drosophila grimshawi]|uniref:GH17137 n=1 Tax=Drosophila grimshawi TaxID=7222 RepID=B4JUA2_DROGR|nr:neprilysin-4 [Drosophila grimshawi]EDV91072.1 GH17137 [Drosophila grimshawi]